MKEARVTMEQQNNQSFKQITQKIVVFFKLKSPFLNPL